MLLALIDQPSAGYVYRVGVPATVVPCGPARTRTDTVTSMAVCQRSTAIGQRHRLPSVNGSLGPACRATKGTAVSAKGRRRRSGRSLRVVSALEEAASVAITAAAPTALVAAKYFASGGVCTCASHTVGVPLDVVKTRVQSEAEDSPLRVETKANGLAAGAAYIVREEGAHMLLQGIGPTFTGYFLQGSLKYGLYQMFKGGITATGGELVLMQLLAASLADVFGSTVLCPLEATRIRLVVQPEYASGFLPAYKRLSTEEGMNGLFRTLPAVLAKQIPYTALQLVTFDQVRSLLLSAGASPVVASLVGALSAAVPASLASQPGDTLLTKLNERRPPSSQAKKEEESAGDEVAASSGNMLTCASEMRLLASELGPAGLFLGWNERLWHVGTIVVAQLLINDAVKHSLGL